jgi:hypothetical protein
LFQVSGSQYSVLILEPGADESVTATRQKFEDDFSVNGGRSTTVVPVFT